MISNGVPTAKAKLIAREIKRTLMLYYEATLKAST
jgi:hypothetical protein